MKKTSGNLVISLCLFVFTLVLLWLLVWENGIVGLFGGETLLTICAPAGICESANLFGGYGVLGSVLNITLGLVFSALILLLGYLYLPADAKKKLKKYGI